MKSTINLLFLLVVLILIVACNKEESTLPLESQSDCIFGELSNTTDGILDEGEIALINNCRENELTTTNAITNNLIGEWELVGFGDGWFSNVTQPCGYLTVTPTELRFEFHNEYFDTISIHQWEIENNWLKVDPVDKHLAFNVFCEDYLHGSFTEVGTLTLDVDQYLYEKVK